MAITPIDIHNKVFNKGFRGYDEDEVNEFLEQVMHDFETLIDENKQLKKDLSEKEEQAMRYTTLEETLQKSIVVAQEAAEDVRRNATQEAKLIVKEAEKNADRIVNDALVKSRAINLEIDDLKKQSKVFRNRLKLLVEAQLELLKTDDWNKVLEMNESFENVETVEDIQSIESK
ncbi:MAG TPA: DivIVA domain-containing protein [Savagea sp.]